MHNIQIHDGPRTITFLAAAIQFNTADCEVLMKGERHCHIIQEIAEAGLTNDYKQSHIDGFLCRVNVRNHETTTFISRENATLIAKRANYPMIGSILTSEDLW